MEKGIYLEVADRLSDSWVQADQQQLRRALGAVVQNGIEAASDRGWVRVSQERIVEAVVTFTVEDSGPGLTPEAAEHTFDPFFCGAQPVGAGDLDLRPRGDWHVRMGRPAIRPDRPAGNSLYPHGYRAWGMMSFPSSRRNT